MGICNGGGRGTSNVSHALTRGISQEEGRRPDKGGNRLKYGEWEGGAEKKRVSHGTQKGKASDTYGGGGNGKDQKHKFGTRGKGGTRERHYMFGGEKTKNPARKREGGNLGKLAMKQTRKT